jgi:hypothetical protein
VRDFVPEDIISLEESGLSRQIDVDRPFHAFVEKLGMRGGIEEAIEIRAPSACAEYPSM